MLFRALFYNLIQSFRLQVLPETEKGETWHTLRMKYLIIPAVLGSDGKEIILRLALYQTPTHPALVIRNLNIVSGLQSPNLYIKIRDTPIAAHRDISRPILGLLASSPIQISL